MTTPDKVSDFRPIACCNVLYKCISKILTNRIKWVLGKIVNENQSAFIEGRQITDNILLAQELFRGYNRKQSTKKVAFKIDLQKAYDTINWQFLRSILKLYGFNETMVDWVMTCVTTTKFSISINGERVGYFNGGMGLRQEEYHFFGGLNEGEKAEILSIISFSVGRLQVNYLGVPLVTKSISISERKPLVDRVRTKSKGGLGLKNLAKWNEVLMIKHIWNVASKKDTLWVKWVNIERLKGRSVWEIQCDGNSSMGWRSIMSLRDKVREHIWWKIGNGNSVSAWHDKWSNASPLSDIVSARERFSTGLNNNNTIPIFHSNTDDKAVWITNNGDVRKFEMKAIWNDLCNEGVDVEWYSMRKLLTQDRIMVWKPNEDLKCALCKKCPDTHNHLLFSCEYSNSVWKKLLSMLNVRLSDVWDNIVAEMISLPRNKNIRSITRKLVCSAAVYYIWQERNNRLFKREERSVEIVLKIVTQAVKMKLIGLLVKDSKTVKEVEVIWRIEMKRR
ncbi:RNA-directed DNA polymerase, eukaryota, reverse transcriptase zinc-binding domain protein [Tanacetum coccineum]